MPRRPSKWRSVPPFSESCVISSNKRFLLFQELKVKAKKDLEDWYKKYTEQLEKTKSDNRKSEKTFVAEMDEIKPGTEWDRVSKLCEFNSKNNKNAKDQSRMRSILLQLKQNPKPIASN